MTTVDISPKAGPRQWFGLAVLCLPTMLAAVDINVMFLALPQVTADLGANSIEQLWITDIYGFMVSGFLITMGMLGDLIGRRRLLLLGATAFIVASLLAAYSTSTTMLLGSRALLGIAGAAVTPSVLALIRTMFRDPRQMVAAMGMWGTSLMAGIVLGPVVGGLLLGAFGWGSIFLMGVPIMAMLLLAGPFLVPESRNPSAGRLDAISVVLSLATILPIIYGLKEAARTGWDVPPIAAIVAGLVLMLVFVQRQRKLSSPLLDLSLFNSRALATAALLALCAPLFSGGTTLMATLFLQMVQGLMPFRVALWMLAPAIAMIVVGNLAAATARKVRPAYVLAAGAVLAAIGMLVITQVTNSPTGLATLLTGLTIAFVGGGAVGILSATLIMSSAPPEKAGSAGSLSGTLGELGTALGVAILGLIGTVVYRAEVTVPAGVPAGAAGAARESIASAVPAARQVSGQAGADLLTSVRDAFTSGLNVVALIAAVLFLGLAILAIVGLRHVRAVSASPAASALPTQEPGTVPAVD
ncbi:MFS transporter [Nonomuraea sp. NPDC049152]|uniref:MFS transporter n=1 Tax=Nonomuraea sp. NPDC049152 TaxID=3154350 RepID=UPI0033EA418D